MEEDLYEIKDYLPLHFKRSETEEFIDFLGKSYLENENNEKYQFSFLAFYMLYISLIYVMIWNIKSYKNQDFINVLNTFSNGEKNKLKIYTDPFTLSVLSEREIFKFLQIIGFHPNKYCEFSRFVDIRNDCAHPVGEIQYNKEKVLKFIHEIKECIISIHKKYCPVIEIILVDFLNKCVSNNLIEEENYESIIDQYLIRDNFLSKKDLEHIFKTIDNFKDINNVEVIFAIKKYYESNFN